ncbi:hypothetical protein [Rhodococcus sp. NPDC058514]|uniref:hypothetical protein n=1 Tax=unclassified Rhodococcus (in: high G+C Gram-positive bacteria) TaxID=192944 RepID=UPI003667BBBD
MTELGQTVSEFQQLAAQAESGHLRLNEGVAQKCVQACETFIFALEELRHSAQDLSTLSAYGTLQSAQDLGRKFERKALGEDGFESIIRQHIEVVQQMQDVFAKAGKAYAAAEESNTQALGAAGSTL